MAKHAFDKFINKEPKGAKKKEALRQEKKRLKKEARAIGEQRRREKWEKQRGITPTEKRTDERPARKIAGDNFKQAKTHIAKGNPKIIKHKPANRTSKIETRPVKSESPFERKNDNIQAVNPKTGSKSHSSPVKKATPAIHRNTGNDESKTKPTDRSLVIIKKGNKEEKREIIKKNSVPVIKKESTGEQTKPGTTQPANPSTLMPLNKFISHAGICGRREAAELVKQGLVQVNNSTVTEPGFKVSDTDNVTVKGKEVFKQNNPVYILLNKPKDYITTSDDPQGRKTVLDIVKKATPERIYPVGRLDRNTTGVLLLTNDGELAQKLTHPSFEVRKVYEVSLDKPLAKKDYEQILTGVTLEDGFVQADVIGYADPKDKSIIGVEIHSGRNRIVRRIFEHLGYDVKALDRVMFGNLTKKNVERGKWRFLSVKEVRLLKFMNQSFVRKKKTGE